ncbi:MULTISPECIES: ATP-binding protein [Tsukamurella]|uniref:ATP-binding protein n=2 Tax=Tsukamurella TaxID=2060 RepID=A0A5C5S1H1_9ACTN|nr:MULTISPECIES: ATP-binding protein [Tsukamurella]NMD54635.1 ATP-binding protein [Tsukamurella columbiensis]TWS28550.1 ATP-binding protein [Tsukamurella conjunctivitidis]
MAYTARTAPAHPVDLSVPADLSYLPVVRAVPEALAIMLDLDIDIVSDLGLAIDQICTELIADAQQGANVELRIELAAADLTTTVTARTRSDRAPDRSGFGWRVLNTLTEGLEVERAPAPGGGWSTSVSFRSGRGAV